MESTHRTIKNSIYSFLGYGWPIIISLFITPVIVSGLGIKNYGIYIFFNTVLSFMGLLDFGVSTAVGKYLAEYHGRGDMHRIKALLATANTIFLGVGVAGLIVFLVGVALPSIFPIFSDYGDYKIGLIAAGLLFLVSSISSTYTLVVTALQRFDVGTKIGIASLTVQQISILILVLNHYSINAIFVTQLIFIIITLFVQVRACQKIMPETVYRLGWDKIEAKKSYIFGLVTFLNNMATVSLTYLDRLIMPFFLGPSALTYYSLPGNIAMKVPGVSNSLAAVLFPMASSLSGSGEFDRLKTLYIRSFRLITVLAAAISVTAIAFSRELLTYWISPDLAAKATTVMIILVVTNFVLALTGPLSSFLLGLGKLKFLTTLSIIMALINTILLVILMPIAGITGAAWAYLLSLIPSIYMFYYTEQHYLKLDRRMHYYVNIIWKNLLVSVIMLFIARFVGAQFVHSLTSVFAIGAVIGIMYLTLYYLFGFFEQEDVESMKLFFKKISKRNDPVTSN